MSSFLRDLAYAVRNLRKSPGLTIVMVLALAVGLAVNASAFLFVHALVLKPLPFRDLGGLMTIWESPVNANERGPMAPANYLDIRQESRSFESMAAYRGWDVNLTGIDNPERLIACRVSDGFFDVLGMGPERGRTFAVEEWQAAGRRVAVVSDGFWKRRMASASDAVGSVIALNGEAYTIVGIMPSDFNFPLETEVWVPLPFSSAERNDRGSHDLAVIGRLKPGVPVAQARTELGGITRRLAALHPDTNENRGAHVVPILEMINSITDRFCMTLFATAGFVLLLACANVGNLLLVRLAGQQRELAVRTALGANRRRLVSQLIAESLVVSGIAGVVGLVFAAWNLSFTVSQIPPFVLRWVAGLRNLHLDGAIVMYVITASFVVGLVCAAPGIVQVLRGAAGLSLVDALKDGGRGGSAGRSRTRLRSILAVGEVVLALVLMIAAGVMVQTFNRLLAVNPGFNTQNLLTFQVALAPNQYSGPAPVRSFYENLRTGLDSVPSAASAAISSELGDADGLWIEGRADPRPGEPRPSIRAISPDYFRTFELTVLSGRPISVRDSHETEPSVVLSDSVVRHYWPAGNAVGARVRLHKGDPRWYRVVGVSGDTRDWFFGTAYLNGYVAFAQQPQRSAGVFVRTSGDPMGIASAVRAEVRKLDRAQPIFDLKSMEQSIAEETSGVRSSAISMTIYAAIALLLAATGIYAIISYSVQQRTHEIGIRMALGADRRTILRMALSGALRIGGVGLAIGIPTAFALVRIMSSVLYGVIRLDALTFISGVAVLAASATAAGYLPALRAARLDPTEALREE